MTDRIEHPTDDLAALALGALDPSEAAAVREHVAICPPCAAEVASFSEVAWSLAELAPEHRPAADLREKVVARVRPRPVADPAAGLAGMFRGGLGWRVPIALPLALAVLLAVTLGGLQAARTELEAARQQADSYARAVDGVVDATVVTLTPAAGSEARGSLVLPVNGDPYLILRLPPPPPGKTWEAWVIRDQRAIAAGISGERSGLFTLRLTEPVRRGDAVAVTLEVAGGTTVPQGNMVLQGRT